MAETRQVTFTYHEIAETLVKQQGIHESLWGVYFEFGIGAANVNLAPDADATPTAIVPITRMGIQRFDAPVPGLTVDATEVNPAS
jgi:hypothetical protein